MTSPNQARFFTAIRRSFWLTPVLVASYTGCEPDFDQLTYAYGQPNGGDSFGGDTNSGGTDTGGTTDIGNGGRGGTGVSGEAGSAGAGHGGKNGEAGAGGESNGGAGGVPNGGAGGEAGSGGSAGVSCDDPLTVCPGTAACTDVLVGNPSGSGVTDCGACGVECSDVNVDSAICDNGVCAPTCSANFADCNAADNTNDGCETDIANTPNACGGCGRVCSHLSATATSCTSSLCTPTCVAGFADCRADDGSGASDDGCETYLSLNAQCGTDCTNNTVACDADKVCNAGACGAPQGLYAFTVHMTTGGQIQRYADKFVMTTTAPNLTNVNVMLRLYAPGATGGFINIYPSDSPNYHVTTGVQVLLKDLAKGWTDVLLPIHGIDGSFDPTAVAQVNLDISSGTDTSWAEPTTIYFDALWSADGKINDTFTTTSANIVESSVNKIDGSTWTWLDAMPAPPPPP